MLLPLGPPLPDDAVSAVRGESGTLSGLTVPLKWGVPASPDDQWAPPGEVVPADGQAPAGEWDEWNKWDGEAEPRFDIPRVGSARPHSPAAG